MILVALWATLRYSVLASEGRLYAYTFDAYWLGSASGTSPNFQCIGKVDVRAPFPSRAISCLDHQRPMERTQYTLDSLPGSFGFRL